MELNTIFLDVDGVLADFVTAAARAVQGAGIPHNAANLHGILDGRWPIDKGDLTKALEITNEQMWGAIDAAGPDFWADLEWLPDGKDILASCAASGCQVILATVPSMHPNSTAGKIAWFQKHLGKDFRDYCLIPQKHTLARPGAMLLDDWEKHIDSFCAVPGAIAILVDRPWNVGRGLNTLERVRRSIAAAKVIMPKITSWEAAKCSTADLLQFVAFAERIRASDSYVNQLETAIAEDYEGQETTPFESNLALKNARGLYRLHM